MGPGKGENHHDTHGIFGNMSEKKKKKKTCDA